MPSDREGRNKRYWVKVATVWRQQCVPSWQVACWIDGFWRQNRACFQLSCLAKTSALLCQYGH